MSTTAPARCSAPGCGLPGDAVDTGGTSGGIGIYADRAVEVPGLFVAPAPLPGRWVVGGAMAATGAAVDWLREVAARLDRGRARRRRGHRPAGANGRVFLPYLAGERAPVFDERARGAFVGLTLGHGRADLARAVLEAAAFSLRHVAEPLVEAGAPLRELRSPAVRATTTPGRGSRRTCWACRSAIPTIESTAVLGAAILAAAGTGLHPDLEAAVAAMAVVDRRIEPDPSAARGLRRRFAVYRSLYPALAPAMHALGADARVGGNFESDARWYIPGRAFGAGCNSRPVVGPATRDEPTSGATDIVRGAADPKAGREPRRPEPTVQSEMKKASATGVSVPRTPPDSPSRPVRARRTTEIAKCACGPDPRARPC